MNLYRGKRSARKVALSIGSWFAFLFPAVMVVISISTVGLSPLQLSSTHELQIGSMIAHINYAGMISGAVMMAAMIFIMVHAQMCARLDASPKSSTMKPP